METYRVPKLENVGQLREYVKKIVAQANDLPPSRITDLTPIGPAAFQLGTVLAFSLCTMLQTNVDMTVGEILKKTEPLLR